MGVWEIVYDGGLSPDFTAGNFKASSVAADATSAAALSQSQTWLSGLGSVVPTSHYNLYVLSDPNLQDQLFGVIAGGDDRPNPVPLPAALPMGLAMLGGIGLVKKLRSR